MNKKKITVAVIGCGARGKDAYASLIGKLEDEMELVAAVDTDKSQLIEMQVQYGVPESNCYTDIDEFFSLGKVADVAFVCTLDKMHYDHAVKAMKLGYHLLLEKPISPDMNECLEIERVAKEYDRYVVVCHVLRYTPFYRKIKELIISGAVGDVVSIQAIEMVGYWHQAHSFVRGNWRNSYETSPMILQKCCHDFDILLWLCDKKCKKITSFGDLRLFKKENTPKGATLRCLDGCEHFNDCPYCAPNYYLGLLKSGNLGWPLNVLNPHPTEENITKALKEGPYGRCVYYCDNNVVDHQVVNMLLEDNTTVNFTMCAFTNNGARTLRIMGTSGEIEADMGKNVIIVNEFGKPSVTIDVNTLSDDFSGHGGGEIQMLRDLFALVRGENSNNGISLLEQSMESHYLAFAAEESRLNDGAVIDIKEFVKQIR